MLAYQSAGPGGGAAIATALASPAQAPAAAVWGIETILECWATGAGAGFSITTNVNSPTIQANIALNGTAPALFVAEFTTKVAATSMTGDTVTDVGATINALTFSVLS